MIQVHNIFVCKPGNASKLAKMMKTMPFDPVKGPYVLTDMTGQFHRVVMISNHDSLEGYAEDMKKEEERWKNPDPEETKKWAGMNDMYVSGSREIYKVW